LTGATLPEANLTGASLIGSQLAGANLYGSSLVGALLVGTKLSGADLRSANLTDARVLHTRLAPGLAERNLLIDPELKALNEAQLREIFRDADLNGAQNNNQTRWPATLSERGSTP
jgi:uncharacterized protein YjbI with pentapeptide repeats